jgi:hypothetical protein
MSFKVEVIADTSNKWCGNGLAFSSHEEAADYGRDLASRWFAVREYRVVTSDDPVSHTFVLGLVKPWEEVT